MKRWLGKPLPFGMWLATCFVIGLLFAGGLKLYDQIRSNRVSSIEQLCMHDNANAQANIDFLKVVSPDVVVIGRKYFKLTGNCHAFAVRAVKARP